MGNFNAHTTVPEGHAQYFGATAVRGRVLLEALHTWGYALLAPTFRGVVPQLQGTFR